ncbi:MAG: hypothetical protein WD448_01570, partial [Woeseia sp.]
MLHGITLWSVGTALMLLLGAWGVGGLIQTGTAAVGTVISAGTSVGAAGAQGAQAGAGKLADLPLMTTIQARIKRAISSALAEAQRGQRPASADGTPAASQQEIRRAIEQIDADTLFAAAEPIIAGEPDRAKDVLAINTNLSEREINTIVDGVSQEMSQQIEEAQQQVKEAVEAASTYTQAVMWVAFFASVLGLVVAIVGGRIGAGTVRKLYARDVSRQKTI